MTNHCYPCEMTREIRQDLTYYRGNPFSKSEVSPTLGIFDLICWHSCSRISWLTFIKKSNYINRSPRGDPKQGTYSLLTKLHEVYLYLFLFRLAKVFSKMVFLHATKEALSSLVLWSPPRGSVVFHERNLVGLRSTSFASCEEDPLYIFVGEANSWCWCSVEGRTPLCSTKLVFSYCSQGGLLSDPCHLVV